MLRFALSAALAFVSFVGFVQTAHAQFQQGGRTQTEMVTCMSKNYQPASCGASGDIVDIRLINQQSKSACIEGQTFGYSGSTVWVNNGCHAQFQVTIQGQSGRYQQLRCESASYRFTSCNAGFFINDVRVNTQLSRTACQEGISYGIRGGQLWVDKGCAAIFDIAR